MIRNFSAVILVVDDSGWTTPLALIFGFDALKLLVNAMASFAFAALRMPSHSQLIDKDSAAVDATSHKSIEMVLSQPKPVDALSPTDRKRDTNRLDALLAAEDAHSVPNGELQTLGFGADSSKSLPHSPVLEPHASRETQRLLDDHSNAVSRGGAERRVAVLAVPVRQRPRPPVIIACNRLN